MTDHAIHRWAIFAVALCAVLHASPLSAQASCPGDKGLDAGCQQRSVATQAKAFLAAQLVGSDAIQGHQLGISVALSGNTAVVGALPVGQLGVAYVFVHDGAGWTQQAKLVAPDGILPGAGNVDRFGEAVAIDGDTIAVGNPTALTNNMQNSGAVYIFVRNGTAWNLQQKLPGEDSGNLLGGAVSLSGSDLVVGEPGAEVGSNLQSGRVRVYTRNGTLWTEHQRLVGDAALSQTDMGQKVTIHKGVIAASTTSGFVYVFRRAGSTWSQEARLQPPTPLSGDQFGKSLALDGDLLAIGDSQSGSFPSTRPGTVYLFGRIDGLWGISAILTPASALPGTFVGSAVAISGDTLLVGARGFEGGRATVFVRDGAQWIEQESLSAPVVAGGGGFGAALALERRRAIVGAPEAETVLAGRTGAAFVAESVGRLFEDGFE